MLEKKWISVTEASFIVGCTPQHLRLLAKDAKIPCERVGHAYLLDKDFVQKMAENPKKTGRPRGSRRKNKKAS